MNKEELYQKLCSIYGGQKELIDDVLNAFDNLEHLNKMLLWSKDRLNKSDYELQQENKKLHNKIDKAIEYLNKVKDEQHETLNMYEIDDLLEILKDGDTNE